MKQLHGWMIDELGGAHPLLTGATHAACVDPACVAHLHHLGRCAPTSAHVQSRCQSVFAVWHSPRCVEVPPLTPPPSPQPPAPPSKSAHPSGEPNHHPPPASRGCSGPSLPLGARARARLLVGTPSLHSWARVVPVAAPTRSESDPTVGLTAAPAKTGPSPSRADCRFQRHKVRVRESESESLSPSLSRESESESPSLSPRVRESESESPSV
eukprot:gene7553-biopygen21057